jgi:glyoxylase-like metal-dependent hydrolase (beta-lactamase superfamily II)
MTFQALPHRSLKLILLTLLIVSPLCAATAMAQESEVTFKSTELAPGLYMIEGVGGFGGGNVGLLTGKDGVVLVDDSFPPLTETLLAVVDKVAGAPVDFLVNTHVHGDHLAGNETLGKKGATIVAHDNVRVRLLSEGISAGPEKVPAAPEALPVLTFADAVTFHLNGQEAYVFHVAHAHTDGDAVIHFKDADVIHAGDVLFNHLFPFIDVDSGGSLDGYIAAQETIVELAGEATKIIPGHGSLATRADVEASVAMLRDVRTRIGKMITDGKTVEQVLEAAPLADYEELSWVFITTERMIRQVYRSMSVE